MGTFIGTGDLAPFATIATAQAEAMIDDAEAMAALAAPCITAADFPDVKKAAVKAILRAAILRWAEAGSGAVTTKTAGPFGQTIDTSQPRRSLFWPSEVNNLQSLCKPEGEGKAYSIDTTPGTAAVVHADICALNFGAQYCSCGAVLTQGLPLWERGGYA
ncbi:hypothetical protein [Nocardia sp. NPDC004711]